MPLAHASGLNKLLGYVAMPAMSLFVLPAAAIFAAAKIRSLQRDNTPDVTDQQAILNATALWARRHKAFLHGLLWGTLVLAWIGATSLMLLLYLISLGVLLYVLSGFVKLGVAHRHIIGQSCLMGLMFLGQVSMFSGIGDQDIHFVDPQLVVAVFLGGVLVLLPLVSGSLDPWVRRRFKGNPRWVVVGLIAGLLIPLRNDLTPRDRDYLEKRLHVTLEELAESPYDVLETALRVTQLLEVIQRPIDRARYRDRVHDWLRKFHSKQGGGFQAAGGFRQYLNEPEGFLERFPWSPVGSVEVTSYAVQLMRIYGVPDGLDLNWVRSFLRPRSSSALSEDKWMTAVTLDRLNLVPGAAHPTWLAVVYYERSLIMAALLVALCIYATLSSARLRLCLNR